MIFRGRYRYNSGAHRPFLTAYILASGGRWIRYAFLLDTGADVTFLPYRAMRALEIDVSRVEVRDDVGGIGGYGIPYISYATEIRLVSPTGARVFGGTVNVFLDLHATDVPLLGRDVLDNFVCIFDRAKSEILLLDTPDTYQVVSG